MKTNSMLYLIAVAAVLMRYMAVVSTACDSSAPEVTIKDINQRCQSIISVVHASPSLIHRLFGSRSGSCHQAVHDYCSQVINSATQESVGVVRESSNSILSLSCIKADWMGDVTIRELNEYFLCSLDALFVHNCLRAVVLYCKDKLGSNYAGLSQGIKHSVFTVGCFKTSAVEYLTSEVVDNLNADCKLGVYWEACFAAASTFCSRFLGYSGGIPTDVDSGGMTIACYDASYYGDVYLERTEEFYEARRTAVEICDLDFHINAGKILESGPEVLRSEIYDNSGSDTVLRSTFSLASSVTETSHFEYSTSLSIGAEVSVETSIPFVGTAGISLSTELTSSFGTSEETSITKDYTHTTEVEVDPFKRIMIEATITRAEFDVPWDATVRTALGTVRTISGTWYGVSTFALHVEQTNV